MQQTPGIRLSSANPLKIQADLLIVPIFKDGLKSNEESAASKIIEAMGEAFLKTAAGEKFTGQAGQSLLIHTLGKIPADRVLFAGIGEPDYKNFHEGIGEAVRISRKHGINKIAVTIPEAPEIISVYGCAVEAAILGAYRFDKYLSNQLEKPCLPPLKEIIFHVVKVDASVKNEVQTAGIIAEAVNAARNMVNESPSGMTPKHLSRFAKSLANENDNLNCIIRGAKQIEQLKMGLFRGVSLGADTEPQFITLEYRPPKNTKRKGIAIIGKGITFDAGGYNLKPSPGISGMKMDMGGAAAALAAMKAIAAIKPPMPVTCHVGACENLISGRAYKPDDVLISRKGLSVEITNTDAEGRLVMADLLAYASEKNYEALVDIATLTGACIVALGPYTAGAISNNEPLRQKLLDAAEESGEDTWPLPLNRALKEQLKSDIADMKNAGDRLGGAITAALFLEPFAGDIPWVHLDIAGPAMYARDKGPISKGASGAGVKTLVGLVRKIAAE